MTPKLVILHNPKVPRAVHRALRIVAAQEGVTLQALVESVICAAPAIQPHLRPA